MRSQAVHKLSPLHHWCSYQEGSIQNVGDHSFIQPLTTSQEALDKLSDRAPVTQLGEEVGDQEGAREPKQKDKTNTFRKRNLLIADNVVNLQTAKLQTKIIKLQISIRQPNQVLCICVDFIQSNRLWVNMLIPKADFLIAKSNIKAQVITQKSEREKRISNHGNLLATFRFMRLLSGIFLFEASILRMKKKAEEARWMPLIPDKRQISMISTPPASLAGTAGIWGLPGDSSKGIRVCQACGVLSFLWFNSRF